MSRKLSFVLVFLAIFSILLSGAVSLEPPHPDKAPPERETERVQPEAAPADGSLWNSLHASHGQAARPGSLLRPEAPQVSLGTPGVAFSYQSQFGTTREPYPSSTSYLNGPAGVFVDGDDYLYVMENEGSRMIRYGGTPNPLVIGHSGMWWSEQDYLAWPEDVVADSTGDIWIVDQSRVSRYSSSGSFEMMFPSDPDEASQCLDDNDHFCYPTGIAMSGLDRLYVSDSENHRIQVFTISGGSLVYSTTIGTVGTPGTGNNQFNYPGRLAVDGSGNLFVADQYNYRVQKCSYGTHWTCTTFHGVTGIQAEDSDDTTNLGDTWGIEYDPAGYVYITDIWNSRVVKCPTGATGGSSCPNFLTYPTVSDPYDVAIDTHHNVYVADWYNSFQILKFNSLGIKQPQTWGTMGVAFPTDASHIYSPHGMGLDASGNLYVSERYGHRWIKYNKSGAQVWTKGTAGYRYNDSEYFGDQLVGNPAISGNTLYLPSGSSRCVRLYDLDGNYQSLTIGTCHGNTGDSGTLLGAVSGVAVSPVDGKIYVVDRGNSKVKVYDSGRNFLYVLGAAYGTIGLGNGNYQFDYPVSVVVDKSNNIYVADRNNHRVKKYNSSGQLTYTFGALDDCRWEYGYLCAPTGLAIDSSNRLYIAENWNNRVSIYDSATGAYLDTLGGWSGSGIGRINSASGVAVDTDGTVYVAEQNGHRISKFKYGARGWVKDSINGFGDPNTGSVDNLEVFGDYLYASGYYYEDLNQLYRKSSGGSWTKLSTTGIGHTYDWDIEDLTVFDGKLYAATWTQTKGGEVLRSSDGLAWTQVNSDGFGDGDNHLVANLTAHNGWLYATTISNDYSEGAEVWRCQQCDNTDWQPIEANGFGDPLNYAFPAVNSYDGSLYVGTENYNRSLGTPGTLELWKCTLCDGTDWTQVSTPWADTEINLGMYTMEVFQGKLFAHGNGWGSVGAEVWFCDTCDGSDWTQSINNGQGDNMRDGNAGLIAYDGSLYFLIGNGLNTGLEVLKTSDGLNWTQVGWQGFGDPNNRYAYLDHSLAVFNDTLYVGTTNGANGGEIWTLMNNLLYVPIARR